MPRGIWKWLTENGCDLVRISVTLKTVARERKVAGSQVVVVQEAGAGGRRPRPYLDVRGGM